MPIEQPTHQTIRDRAKAFIGRNRSLLPTAFGEALSRRPLWHQLTLLVMVTSLPLLLLSLLMFKQLIDKERGSIRQGLLVSAKTLAALISNEIDTHVAIANTLSHSRLLLADDLAAFRLQAENALAFVPGAWLALANSDGQILLSTVHPAGAPLPKHSAFEVIQRGFETRQPQVGDLIFGGVSRRWTTFVEVPVFRNGKPIYSISIGLAAERMQALVADHFTNGEVVAIVDRNRRFVARVPAAPVGGLASEGWRAAMAQAPTGLTENKTIEGNWSITGYAQTPQGWTAGVAQLESTIVGPINRIFWGTALVAAALIFLSLALASLIARHAAIGMRRLADTADAVGEGLPPPGFVTPFAEARTIAQSLAKASTELERRRHLLVAANSDLEVKVAERTQDLLAEMRRREETETTLRQAQKMESIGQLTGGIAHDFNNMLTVIMGNLDTVQRRLQAADVATTAPIGRPIEAALLGARSAARLTHRLLAFSRQQPLAPTQLDLNSLLSSTSEMLARTVGETIRLETVAAGGLWPTLADVNQVESCLLNLVVNARDAMPDGGKLTIETANAYLDDAYVARFGDLKAGQYVLLSVTDTGTGIPADKLQQVFDPFFTTKDPGKGTGLGLAMVHGFVKQSAGHVSIYSEVGEGTTVKIYLPRLKLTESIAAAPEGSPVVAEPLRRARPGETVLVVEDDPGVREYAISALEDLGYRVLAAEHADQALQIVLQALRVDLLFTDVVLGGSMNGRQLANKILAERPTLPVLFTTGYTRNAIVHQGRLDDGVHLLNKPYTQRELSGKLARLLGQ